MRSDGRRFDEIRSTSIVPQFLGHSLGSALICVGRTRVVCSANLEAQVPRWLEKEGWITAEYAMLPGATQPRGRRDAGGRGKEIQRLIGRALRACVDRRKLRNSEGPISLICDCDVLEADGGTRTAAITGAWVALALALRQLSRSGQLVEPLEPEPLAAISVGLIEPVSGGEATPMLDLPYEEDSRALVDLNVAMLGSGAMVEVQGTGEGRAFQRHELAQMLDMAEAGIRSLFAIQAAALAEARG